MRPQRGKQKLFDAAMKLFEANGYFHTTVEEITVEAGVSKGLVYNYFRSKEELLIGLLEDATERMASVAKTLAPGDTPGDTPEESLSTFLDVYLRFLQEERQFLKLQLMLSMMPELREVVIAPQRRRAALLLDMLTDWFRQAKLSRPRRKARLLAATLDGVALHYLCIYEQYPLTSMKPQLLQLMRDLCNEKSGDRP